MRRLQECTPPQVLRTIQNIVDGNTMNSSYITMKQLTLELLHLTQKHDVSAALIQRLVQAEAVSSAGRPHPATRAW